MAKRTKKQVNRDLWIALFYRWEFCRRSSKYQQDYKSWLKLLKSGGKFNSAKGEMINKYDFPPFDFQKDINQIHSEYYKYLSPKITVKYLDEGQPYLKKYPYLCMETEIFFQEYFRSVEVICGEDFEINDPYDDGKPCVSRGESKVGLLNVIIDLNFPKEAILFQVDDIVESFQTNQRQVVNADTGEVKVYKVDSGYKRRNRVLLYEDYLSAYHLMYKGPNLVKKSKIHYATWPVKNYKERNDRGGNIYDSKIQRDYEMAIQYIDGGYKKIK